MPLRPYLVIFYLLGLPLSSFAGSTETPSFVIPFDDFDETALQAEVSKQALAFLGTLHEHWGKNPSAIRAAVTGTIRDDQQGKLIYLRNVGDHGALEGYEFRQDILVRGQYLLLQRPLNRLNEFIDYYQRVKQTVTEQYGQPSLDHIVWENDLYQPVPDYWGVAVMMGQLRYQAKWETEEGTITLDLTGDHHSRLAMNYTSRRFGQPERIALALERAGQPLE